MGLRHSADPSSATAPIHACVRQVLVIWHFKFCKKLDGSDFLKLVSGCILCHTHWDSRLCVNGKVSACV